MKRIPPGKRICRHHHDDYIHFPHGHNVSVAYTPLTSKVAESRKQTTPQQISTNPSPPEAEPPHRRHCTCPSTLKDHKRP